MTPSTPMPDTMKRREPLFAVSIQGPDDIFAAADYLSAIRIANAFNQFWLSKVKDNFSDNDPRMWAVPVEWPYDALAHESELANPQHEYISFLKAARPESTQ